MTLFAHYGGTYLAQTNTVAPALALQDEDVAIFLDIEGRRIQMATSENCINKKWLMADDVLNENTCIAVAKAFVSFMEKNSTT